MGCAPARGALALGARGGGPADFRRGFAGRVLPFDRDAAKSYAAIAAHRRAIGRPISQFDAQIAAIAVSRGASVATRNVADFAETGALIINP